MTVGADAIVWDAERGEEVCRIESRRPQVSDPGFYDPETVAVLNENGSLLAISNNRGDFDRRLPHSVLLFDVQSGRLLKRFAKGLAWKFHPLAFADSGTRLIIRSRQWRPVGTGGASPGTIAIDALWNIQNGELLREFPDEAAAVVSLDGRWIATGCRFERGPNRLASSADTRTLNVWDARTGELVQTLEGEDTIRDFAFNPDGRRVLVAGEVRAEEGRSVRFEGRIIEWDWRSAQRVFEEGSTKPYARVMYSPDGRQRYALTEEVNQLDDNVYCLRGWDVRSGAELPIAEYEVFCNLIHKLYFFPTADRFVKLGWCDYAETKLLSGKIARRLPPRRCEAWAPSFAPDGERLLVGAPCRHVNLSTGEQRSWGCSYWTREEFVADGRLAFVSAGEHLYLVEPSCSTIVWQFPFELPVIDAAISPDARHVAVASGTTSRYSSPTISRVVLIEPLAPREIKFLERTALALSYHPEGQRFVEASPDCVHECDGRSGDRTGSLFSVPGRTLDICYSPDGKQVLACGVTGHTDPCESFDADDEGWVTLWDEDRREAIRLEGHTAPVMTAGFGPDGSRCATGSQDRTIRLWDTTSGQLLHTFRGHLGQVHAISYSPKGDRILSAGQDGAAIWNVAQYATVPVQSTPLAREFKPLSNPYTPTSNAVMSGMESRVTRTLSEYLTASPSDPQPEEWTAVLYGRGTFRDLNEDMIHVLSRPARTVHCSIPLPPLKPQRFSHRWDLVDTSEDGNRRLFITDRGKRVLLTDEDDEILQEWSASKPSTRGALFPSGDEVVIAREEQSQPDKHRYRFDVHAAENGSLLRSFIYEDDQQIGWIDVGPESETILLRMVKSDIVLLDYQTGKVRGEISRPSMMAVDAQYSPDGRFIAVKFLREVTFYDRVTLAEGETLVHPLPVKWCRFSPDGKRLIAGQVGEILTMWDVDSARQLWTRQGYASESTVFSRDGRRFLTHLNFGPSLLWNTEDGRMVAAAIGSRSLALSPDGHSLHLGNADGPSIWSDR